MAGRAPVEWMHRSKVFIPFLVKISHFLWFGVT
jgi:hypothetical protein